MEMPRSTSPEPMVHTTSSEGAIHLRHPTPDLQSLQGAYIGNIERLEERAERMSSRGSDIAEEIRKLHLEQKLSDSRKSSMRSVTADEVRAAHANRSRNASTSSFSNSIVDVNSAARWGGYSPGGFITSPISSIRSGTWSQLSQQRQRSASRASRLGHVMQPDEDDIGHQDDEEPSGSPTMHNSVPRLTSPKPPSHRSVSSFTKQYDQIAQEIQDQFDEFPNDRPISDPQIHRQHDDSYFTNPHDLPDRPPTAASIDTYHQARTLFHDFDGVHCSPVVEEDRVESQGSRNSSLLRSMPAPPGHTAPPPSDNMVFYPAPVPRMLNLPKRLSQLPSATVQAKRRTQLLESMPTDARKSAAWLPDEIRNSSDTFNDSSHKRKSADPRKSVMSLAGLPPQLRASVYFDQVASAQEFEVKGDSAEATLDSILEASAHAPVSAFTDHPFAGHVGNEVYGKEQVRRSTTSSMILDKADARKSRSSLNLLRGRRNSSGDGPNKLQKRISTDELKRLTVRNSSRLSLGPQLEENGDNLHYPEDEEHEDVGEATPFRHSTDSDQHPDVEDGAEEEEEAEGPAVPQFHGPPTTLLAELQMRKQQQKSRNRTAATAYPNGMHSTLLELDAVAEVEKKRRVGQRIALAWEDPDAKVAEEADDDEDVPLGMLFPARDGLINKKGGPGQASDWDRPLGLIAQRELEDSEPLSNRRNRLRGGDPRQRDPSPQKRVGMPQAPALGLEPSPILPLLPGQSATPVNDDGEEETLAQRKLRLRNREALDAAISDVRARPVSGEFVSEMLNQFGASKEDEKPKPEPAGEGEEEETLGQRRARLQAEALARGGQIPANGNNLNPANATHPPLKSSHSLADLLSAHPINSNRKISNEVLVAALPQGSLLQRSEVKKTRQKADLLAQNQRNTSYGTDKPLLDIGKGTQDPALAPKTTAFKGGVYNNGMGGAGLVPTPVPVPGMLNGGMGSGMGLAGQPSGYFPNNMGMPTPMPMNFAPNGLGMMPQQMGMGMNMGMPMAGMPMNGFQGFGYPQMSGMQQMPMQMGMPGQMQMDPMMDSRQRDMIDRWRQSIMH